MLAVSNALSALFGLVMAPFRSLPLTGMIVISVLTGILMLIIYKYTSNQSGITRAKDRIKANFLAIMLYSDSLVVLLKSIGSILKWNLVYMAHNLKPLAVMIVPVLLLLVQLNFWYGYRPIEVDEPVLVQAEVSREIDLAVTPVALEASEGVVVESPGVRATQTGQITWRVRATQPGDHTLSIKVGDEVQTKHFVVNTNDKLFRLAPLRHNGNFWDALLYPGEPRLPADIRSIQVQYPVVEMNLLGWHMHWIIVYFILSILAGLSMKGLFKVDI